MFCLDSRVWAEPPLAGFSVGKVRTTPALTECGGLSPGFCFVTIALSEWFSSKWYSDSSL